MRIRAYFAVSIDGYIADSQGGIAWLRPFESPDYGFEAFLAGIGVLVMGRATYDQVRTLGPWPYGQRPTYVMTSRPLGGEVPPGVVAWLGDPAALLERLRGGGFVGDVWHVGGGRALDAFRALGAIDSWDLFVIPVLLGKGVPMLLPQDGLVKLVLADHRVFPNGVVALKYAPVPPTRLSFAPFSASG